VLARRSVNRLPEGRPLPASKRRVFVVAADGHGAGIRATIRAVARPRGTMRTEIDQRSCTALSRAHAITALNRVIERGDGDACGLKSVKAQTILEVRWTRY